MDQSSAARPGLVPSFLRRLASSARPIVRRQRTARPAAEPLEGRALLAAVTFPRPDHVVIVIEENHSFRQIIGSPDAPYLNSLAGSGTLFTSYHAQIHPSQPNYLTLFSGITQGVTDDATPTQPFTSPNLGASLIRSGRTFAGYSEGLPSVGSNVSTAGAYARKHNPWVNWQGASTNGLPASVNRPFTSFPKKFFASLPTVSFVVPDLNNDMHDGTVATADTWLKQNIGPYATWAKTHNSLLIVTWDEGDGRLPGTENNHIPTIFVGPMVKTGRSSQPVTHLNLLRTVAGMYGLRAPGDASKVTPITSVFKKP